MLKALMPASVYLHGLVYGVETGFAPRKFGAILVICGGVLLASLGEIEFRNNLSAGVDIFRKQSPDYFTALATEFRAQTESNYNLILCSPNLRLLSLAGMDGAGDERLTRYGRPLKLPAYVSTRASHAACCTGMSLDSCVQTERMSSYLSQFSYAVSGKCLKFVRLSSHR
eukprot:scaffold1811_cov411-Prasinococcus_capsulatus_cf.AAC.6